MDELKRYYQILEVPYGAPLEEVQRKYRDLAAIWHPDRFAHNPRLQAMALDKLKEINGAYHDLAEYLKQHGPPPIAAKGTRKESVSEKLARERARAEREAKAWAEARARAEREREALRREAEAREKGEPEKAAARKKAKLLVKILAAAALLIAVVAGGFVFTRQWNPPDETVAVPSHQAAPRSQVPSPPVTGQPSGISPLSTPPQVQSVQQTRFQATPAPRPVALPSKSGAGIADKPPLQPAPQQPDHALDFIRNVNPEQVYGRCLRHSPADWCAMVTDRCRDYLKDCRKLSLSDSGFQESAACRGVTEWCHKNPQRAVQVVPELDERSMDSAE
jgi:hypothetical protein